jgi:hypothetical protein
MYVFVVALMRDCVDIWCVWVRAVTLPNSPEVSGDTQEIAARPPFAATL